VAGSVNVAEAPTSEPTLNAWLDPSADAIHADLDLTPGMGTAVLELLDASGARSLRSAQLGDVPGKRTERIDAASLSKRALPAAAGDDQMAMSGRRVVLHEELSGASPGRAVLLMGE
jgi:hypothetical protein